MRFLSVFLPRLSTDRILRDGGAKAPDAPFAVWTKIKGGDYLAAVDARAQNLGLKPSMTVADARAMRPSLRLEQADPQADADLLASIADWHRRFTPLAALDPPDGVMLDVAGAAHLFGGETALLDEIEGRLAAQGFAARAAVAPGPALARALARFSDIRRIPPQASQQEIEAVAARLPIAALGLASRTQDALVRAGLRHIGDLLERPRAPIAARFGAEAIARLDALVCRAREPISPRFEAPDFIAERRFLDGLTRIADIEATLEALARDLCLLLERHGVGLRRMKASFYRVDGAVKHVEAGTSRPLRDPMRLSALLNERLAVLCENGLDTGYGFDVLRLGATLVERLDPPQTTLAITDGASATHDRQGLADLHDRQDFADLIDKLGARLGLRRILRLDPQDSHIPEFAIDAVPASSPLGASVRGEIFGRKETYARIRPLRLFERPEPIEAIALTPDGPPLRFRWRRALHEIATFEGPERIAPQWWRTTQEKTLTRDYFYAEDREGRKFWLFREGLYGRECASPRWFVHGLS
jgi:protein ImuB